MSSRSVASSSSSLLSPWLMACLLLPSCHASLPSPPFLHSRSPLLPYHVLAHSSCIVTVLSSLPSSIRSLALNPLTLPSRSLFSTFDAKLRFTTSLGVVSPSSVAVAVVSLSMGKAWRRSKRLFWLGVRVRERDDSVGWEGWELGDLESGMEFWEN